MSETILSILKYLQEKRGYDFIGNRISMLERRISKRVFATGCKDFHEYYVFIQKNPSELERLVNMLTINVSRFFRDSMMWEFLNSRILPSMIESKIAKNEKTIRVWSAGSATGEEPYSAAIVLNELLESDESALNVSIIATDINEDALVQARNAEYSKENVENVKLKLLDKYFYVKTDSFCLSEEIRNKVNFDKFDLLDTKRYIPPISVYGSFDIVFCRNVLIYFNSEYQERICEKLYRGLNPHGYLILGEAEIPTRKYKNKFTKISSCCKIYQRCGSTPSERRFISNECK